MPVQWKGLVQAAEGVLVSERPRRHRWLVNSPLLPWKSGSSTTHQAHSSTFPRDSDPVSTEYLWPTFASDYINSQMIITLTASVCVCVRVCTRVCHREVG